MAFVALLDANVLYPAYLRDALLRLAEAEVYQVRWSRQILDEMARNVLENHPDLPEERIERLVRTMERAFPDAMVTGHEPLIPSMTNDPKDRHVLAAAVRGRADVVVTSNVRDFPPEACEPYDVDVQTPDEFLRHQWEVGANLATAAATHTRHATGRNPRSSSLATARWPLAPRCGIVPLHDAPCSA